MAESIASQQTQQGLNEHKCTDLYTEKVLLLDQEFTRLTKDNLRMIQEKEECKRILLNKEQELEVLRRENARLKEEQAQIKKKGQEELDYHRTFSIENMGETVNKINESFKGNLNKPPIHMHENHYKDYEEQALKGLDAILKSAVEARKVFNKTLQEEFNSRIASVYKV